MSFEVELPDGTVLEVDAADANAAAAAARKYLAGQNRPNAANMKDTPTIAEIPVPGAMDSDFANSSWGNVLAAKFGPSLTSDPKKAQDILAKNLPGATATSDTEGNPMINYKGQNYYINKPGFTGQDLVRATNPVALGAGMLGLATGGASLPATMLAGGALSGGQSVAEDVLSNAAAGQDMTNIDKKKALIDAGVGAALPPVVNGAMGLLNAGKNLVGLGNNVSKLNPEARSLLLNKLGADENTARSVAQMHPDLTLAETGPNMLASAQGFVTTPNKGVKPFIDALEARNAGTNAAVQGDVQRALGPAGPDQITYSRALRNEKSDTLNPLYDQLWASGAGSNPVDVKPVVRKIDQMLSETDAGTAQGRLLTSMRSKLVDTPAQAAVPSQRVPVTDPRTGNVVRYQEIPGKAAQPETYVGDPQVLHSIKNDLGSLLEFGDTSLGIAPGAVRNGAGKTLYNDLNQTLKTQVPGYEQVTKTAEDFMKRLEGVKTGYNAFDGGKSALPPEVFAEQVTPTNIGDVRMGARARIENALGTRENDLQAMRQILGDSGDWRRQAMSTLYGDQPTSQLANDIAMRQLMRTNYNDLLRGSQTGIRTANAADVARGAEGLNLSSNIPANLTTLGVASKLGGVALDKTANAVRGIGRGDYYSTLGNALGLQGPTRDMFVRQLYADEMRRRMLNSMSIGAAPAVSGLLQ